MNTAELMEKIAQANPALGKYIAETAPEVRESPFRDEIVGDLGVVIKQAQSFDWKGPALGAAVAVGGGILQSVAGDVYDALKRGITKGRDYRSMLKANPDLGDLSAKNVQQHFSTLHKFNPEFASDPMVAGSYVRRSMTMAGGEGGDVDLHTLTNLVGARKNIHDVRKLPSSGMKMTNH